MRRDKKFALLLILSIINVTLASPVVVRERQVRVRVVDVAKDVTAASEKRYNSDNEADPGFVTAPSSPSGSTHNPSSESGASTPLSESTSSGGTSLPSSQVWTEGQHIWPDYPWRAIPVAGTSSTMSGPLSFNGPSGPSSPAGSPPHLPSSPPSSVGSSSSMPSLVDSSGSLTSTGSSHYSTAPGSESGSHYSTPPSSEPGSPQHPPPHPPSSAGSLSSMPSLVDSSGPLLPAGSPPHPPSSPPSSVGSSSGMPSLVDSSGPLSSTGSSHYSTAPGSESGSHYSTPPSSEPGSPLHPPPSVGSSSGMPSLVDSSGPLLPAGSPPHSPSSPPSSVGSSSGMPSSDSSGPPSSTGSSHSSSGPSSEPESTHSSSGPSSESGSTHPSSGPSPEPGSTHDSSGPPSEPPPSTHPLIPPSGAHPALTSAEDKFFNTELKDKMKDYAVLGLVAGSFTGLANAAQKEILGTVSPGAQTIGRDLGNVLTTPARRGVISRRAGLPLHSPPVDLQTREQPASRGLAHVRDEDLRLLSVLTRRALESLD